MAVVEQLSSVWKRLAFPLAFTSLVVAFVIGQIAAQPDFEALLRFRGFYVHPDVADDRKRFLEAACKQGFDSAEFQEFNESKYMTLIDSYRDTAGSKELIAGAVDTYTAVYKDIGLIE